MASFAVPNNNYALLFLIFFSLAMVADDVAGAEDDPIALFIFGDSTADVGTNNFLNTSAQANFAYYGIDFPHSVPTGRFSNGFNTADQVGMCECVWVKNESYFIWFALCVNYFFNLVIINNC